MRKNCKNSYCLHNNKCQCRLEKTTVNDFGMCCDMIVLNASHNHKIYKYKMLEGVAYEL